MDSVLEFLLLISYSFYHKILFHRSICYLGLVIIYISIQKILIIEYFREY